MAELNRLSEAEYLSAPKIPVTVILDNIRSCHNTGSVFRTADALLIEKIILCGITATPPDKEIHKTALDAENRSVGILPGYGGSRGIPPEIRIPHLCRGTGGKSIPLPEFAPEAGENRPRFRE